MSTSGHWHPDRTPAMRHEAVYGDRIVRCFVERPDSMHALLERAVADHGDGDAVVCGAQRWRYRQLDAEVARIAAGLAAQGVVAGERVVMFMSNRPEFVAVLFALQRIGAIAVPIGEREQKPGLAYMLQQCGACAIVFDAALAERVPDPQDVPALRLRIAAAGEVDGALSLDALGRSGEAPVAIAAVQSQDTALILYTSGTTGRPKGAMLSHLNVAHSVRHYEACMGVRAGDRSALAVPASHVTGLIAVIAAMVHVGGAIVILPEFKAAAFLQTMEAERVTHTLMVPAMYTLCLMNLPWA
jgi:long-chain acyl-CoA synthetase